MIEITDLVFDYPGHRALNGVNLSIAASAITAQGLPAGSVASGMGAHRNAQPAVSFLMQSNSHVLPVQRSSRIEP